MNRSDEASRFREFCRVLQPYGTTIKQQIVLPFKRGIELREPQQVLRQRLGDDLEVLDFTTDKLIKRSDNYGSTIVKAAAKVKKEDRIEKLHLVAKILPPAEVQRESFQWDITVAKEIFFYEEIIPAYQKLYRGEFDVVPKFYGGRLAAKSNTAGVDEGAVILLENLKEAGYIMEDRLKGLTREHVKIAVPAIAKFHAIGLAMKYKNPEFLLEMKKHAKPLDMPHNCLKSSIAKMLKMIKNNRQLSAYYERAKSLNKFDVDDNCTFLENLEPEHPWACLVHRDIWINNVMFHKSEGKIDGFKFFDFQNYCFSSPITDLLYFLFTSLQRDFENFDEAIELYRKTVHNTLEDLQCDASLFGKDSFEKRLKEDAKSELYPCVLMARNIETSGWNMMRLSETSARRMKRIFEIYDHKGWF